MNNAIKTIMKLEKGEGVIRKEFEKAIKDEEAWKRFVGLMNKMWDRLGDMVKKYERRSR